MFEFNIKKFENVWRGDVSSEKYLLPAIVLLSKNRSFKIHVSGIVMALIGVVCH